MLEGSGKKSIYLKKKKKTNNKTHMLQAAFVDPVAVALVDKRDSSVCSVVEQPCAAACGKTQNNNNAAQS